MFIVQSYEESASNHESEGKPNHPSSEDKPLDNVSPDRVLAVLELFRLGDVTLDQAAELAGLSTAQLLNLYNKLNYTKTG